MSQLETCLRDVDDWNAGKLKNRPMLDGDYECPRKPSNRSCVICGEMTAYTQRIGWTTIEYSCDTCHCDPVRADEIKAQKGEK